VVRYWLGVVALFVLIVSPASSQRTGGSALMLQVQPEARVSPSQVPFSIEVKADGSVTASVPVDITAWVRALPNRQIEVTARAGTLTGPGGAVAVSAIQWSGLLGRASGGGGGAVCTSGSFGDGDGLLVSGWKQSGTLTCQVSFSLASEGLAPGTYTGRVDLRVR
jgi:hypothetical protein